VVFGLALLNTVAFLIGTTRPPSPALIGFTAGCAGQPQACWYGIVPGITRLEDAWRLLSTYDLLVTRRDSVDRVTLEVTSDIGCAALLGGSVQLTRNLRLDSIPIDSCNDLRLGDLWGQIGLPDRVSSCDGSQARALQFGDEVSVILKETSPARRGLSPFDRVERILMVRRAGMAFALHWHGFAPAWRYQQLARGETCG